MSSVDFKRTNAAMVEKKKGKISLLNTVGKTEYIYIKVILDG